MSTMNQLFNKLKTHGGCIVSSDDCSTMEIVHAQARGDFTVDADGFGYVLRPHEWLETQPLCPRRYGLLRAEQWGITPKLSGNRRLSARTQS